MFIYFWRKDKGSDVASKWEMFWSIFMSVHSTLTWDCLYFSSISAVKMFNLREQKNKNKIVSRFIIICGLISSCCYRVGILVQIDDMVLYWWFHVSLVVWCLKFLNFQWLFGCFYCSCRWFCIFVLGVTWPLCVKWVQ